MSTQEIVNRAMEDATDNGYDFEAWTFTEAAEDLCQLHPNCGNSTPEELKPLVKEWFLNSDVLYRMYDE